MKRLLIVSLVLIAAGFAQEGEKVRAELERTDRMIQEARPLVEPSGSREAREQLGQASDLQQVAWQLFEASRHRLALAKTREARLHVAKALELAQFDPREVEDAIRKTAEFMSEAGPAIKRSGHPKALELWRIANGEQESGRKHFERNEYRLALKFTTAARMHTRAALELIKRHGDPERVEKEVARTRALLDLAKEKVGREDDRAAEVLNKAENWQREAEEALRSNRLQQALKLTLAARELLLRAWEMKRGAVNAELVERALKEIDRMIEQWAGPIKESGDQEAQRLFNQALEHQKSAQGYFSAKKLKAAWLETAIARRLLNRAIGMLESPGVEPGNRSPGKSEPSGDS